MLPEELMLRRWLITVKHRHQPTDMRPTRRVPAILVFTTGMSEASSLWKTLMVQDVFSQAYFGEAVVLYL